MSPKFFAWLYATALLFPVNSLWANPTVAAGWDLLQTDPMHTMFPGLGNLQGVPLNTFDFDNMLGRGLGVQNVGSTDTIVQRLNPVIGPAGTVPVEMVALQLRTVVPVNFAGNGLGNYFLTLQSARGGPFSTGFEPITFNSMNTGGTFDSFFDVFFDIRKDAVDGPIVESGDRSFQLLDAQWQHAPHTLLINGVNSNLSGDGTSDQDFFLAQPIVMCAADGSCLGFSDTGSSSAVPEPVHGALILAGLTGLILIGRFAVQRLNSD